MQFIKEGLLKIDPGLFLWTMLTFIALLAILWKAAWKPIVEALDSRAERVRNDIDNAERSRQEAERLLVEHQQMMHKANEEASHLISGGKAEAEKIKSGIVEKANEESRAIIDRARKEIDIAKDKALDEIKKEIVMLSTDIAAKIIRKNINPDDQKALIKEALDKIRTVQ